jgi:hypothetical protein
MSYFTPDEKLRLSFEPFAPGDPPIGYMDVSHTQLSLARESGGCTVQGRHYVYFPEHDELWRDDILALVHGWRRTDAMAKELPALPPQVQGELL